MEAEIAEFIPIIYEYFKEDVPKTSEEYLSCVFYDKYRKLSRKIFNYFKIL
jgi:hypothetical protein